MYRRKRDVMSITTACNAVENIRALDQRDALALADAIIDDTIAALQRDRNISSRSFTEWELALASLRARIAERIASEIVGHVNLETVLLELKLICGWEFSDA
jgi:hypothetical protein